MWHETQFFILSGLYSERSNRTNYTPFLSTKKKKEEEENEYNLS